MKRAVIASVDMILFSFILGFILYPYMPEQMATHWNAAGQADGFSGKAYGLFLFPVITLAVFGLFRLIPRIDPLYRNIEKFRDYYDRFSAIVVAFLTYVYALTLAWNMGLHTNLLAMLSPAFAAVFYYAGVLMGKAKRNWFIGIRTPWTLSSDRVWMKTHKIGGRLFKAAGVVSLGGVLVPQYAIVFLVVPVVAAAVYAVAYSYVEYKRS